MGQIASGHVDDRPFARTVYTLVARRFTGDLVLEQRKRSYRVAWSKGAVVAAESAAVGDSVGRVAVDAKLIDAPQMGDVLRLLAQGGSRTELEIVAEVGNLSADQLIGLERRVSARRAMRIFALPGASFAMEQPSTLSPSQGQVFDGRWIIYNGLRLHYDEHRLLAELSACVGDRSFQLRPEALALLGVFGFGAGDKPLLVTLRDAPATLAQLTEQMSDAAARTQTLTIVYALAAASCLSLGDGATVSRILQTAQAKPAPPPPAPTPAAAKPAAAKPAPPTPTPAAAKPPPQAKPAPPPPAPTPAAAKPAPPAAKPAPPPPPPPPPAPPASSAAAQALTPTPSAVALMDNVPPELSRLLHEHLALVDQDADHFAMLGVEDSATLAQVQAAYFKLARKLHPDRLRSFGITDRRSQSVFAVINQAFSVLSDADKRTAYRDKLAAQAEGGLSEHEAQQLALNIIQAESAFQRGELALRHSNFGGAHAAFKEALELNPEEAEHHALYAWTQWCTTDDKDSIRKQVKNLLRAAIRLSPKNPAGYFYRGQIAQQSGQLETAEDCFRKVLELDPDHRQADRELRLLHKRSEKKGGLLGRIKGR